MLLNGSLQDTLSLWAIITSLLSTLLAFMTFLYGKDGFISAMMVAFVLTMPLFLVCSLFVLSRRRNLRVTNPLYYQVIVFSLLLTAALHIGWNSLALISAWQKGTLGPAQGYSGLVLWIGSIKTILLGGFVGAIFHYLSLFLKTLKEK